MKSMVFEDSVFEECYFEDITSTHTSFRNCTFIASLFYNTGKCDQELVRVCVCVCVNRRGFGFRFCSTQLDPTGDSY